MKSQIKIRSNSDIQIFDASGKPFSSDKDMTTYCNKFDVSVGSKMAFKIKESTNLINKYHNVINAMFLEPTDRNESMSHKQY